MSVVQQCRGHLGNARFDTNRPSAEFQPDAVPSPSLAGAGLGTALSSRPMPTVLEKDILQRLLEVSRRLGVTADLGRILSEIIDAMRDLLDAERATVFEFDPHSHELFATVAHGLEGACAGEDDSEEVVRFPADQGLAGAAAQTRRTVNVPDAYADPAFNREVDRRTGFRTRSILSIPLLGFDDELIGVAQVLNKRGGAFSARDESIAEALAAHAAVAIKRARLVEGQFAHQRLERELELARDIQRRTFPSMLPTIPGYDIAAWSESADSTGGDAHDVVALDQADESRPSGDANCRQALFVLADATGHGIGPALVATSMRAMIRMGTRLHAGISEIAAQLNRQLCADLPADQFITAWIAHLDAESDVLTSVSAGQAPLFHFHAENGEVAELAADMPPLGILPDLDFDLPQRITLRPGDLFVVATDGIWEATDQAGGQFGSHRVAELIAKAHARPADEIVKRLVLAVERFTGGRPLTDDRTILVIRNTRE